MMHFQVKYSLQAELKAGNFFFFFFLKEDERIETSSMWKDDEEKCYYFRKDGKILDEQMFVQKTSLLTGESAYHS